MSNLLPERWKEAWTGVADKIGQFLERFRPEKNEEGAVEHITSDTFPTCLQFGAPRFDLQETTDELVVTAEVPGLSKDDVAVELSGRRLTISGGKKVTRERKTDDGGSFAESRYGSFSRSLLLPYDISDQQVKANLKNGILAIKLKKPQSEQKRKFRVSVS